jgi:hypothetical protein
MSWFRFSSLVFAIWAVVFVLVPGFTNTFATVIHVTSPESEDWTRLAGLLSLGFAVLLFRAHDAEPKAQRLVAQGVLAATLPCALLMTWWQIGASRRWIRLDLVNVMLLYLISYGMFEVNQTRARLEPKK